MANATASSTVAGFSFQLPAINERRAIMGVMRAVRAALLLLLLRVGRRPVVGARKAVVVETMAAIATRTETVLIALGI